MIFFTFIGYLVALRFFFVVGYDTAKELDNLCKTIPRAYVLWLCERNTKEVPHG